MVPYLKDLPIYGTPNAAITATDFKNSMNHFLCLCESIWEGEGDVKQIQYSTAYLSMTPEGLPLIVGSGLCMTKDGTYEDGDWQVPDKVNFYQGFNCCAPANYLAPEAI